VIRVLDVVVRNDGGHSSPLHRVAGCRAGHEDDTHNVARPAAYAAYGQNSFVGKILEIHQELPGRIHVVIVRQAVGF
jgi:hypothetical protein